LALLLLAAARHHRAPATLRVSIVIRIGNHKDAQVRPHPGTPDGGGLRSRGAVQWICEKAPAGFPHTARRRRNDDYTTTMSTSLTRQVCRNHVSRVVKPREADPKSPQIIQQAEAVFMPSGDQGPYIEWWRHSPFSRPGLPSTPTSPPPSPWRKPARAGSSGRIRIFRPRRRIPTPTALPLTGVSRPLLQPRHGRRDFLQIPLLTIPLTGHPIRPSAGKPMAGHWFLAACDNDGWSAHHTRDRNRRESAVLIEEDEASA